MCTGPTEPATEALTEAPVSTSTTEVQGVVCDAAQFAYDNVKYDSSELESFRDIVFLSGARLQKTRHLRHVTWQTVSVRHHKHQPP